MKFLDIPAWLYFPFKLILMVSFLAPVLLWGGQMLGVSQAQETALAKKVLQGAERQARTVQQYLDQERDKPKSQAEAETGRVAGKGEHTLVIAQQNVLVKTEAPSEGPVGHNESVKGIDVSHYQGVVHWDRAAEAGIHFAYAKATGGEHFVDPRFHENWHGMRAAEVYRGAYHFYYAAEDPQAQAKHFFDTVGKLRLTDLPPALDVEISDHTDKKTLLEGVLIWLETVEKALGRRPVLYTNPDFGDQYLKDARLSSYPLWIADYATEVSSVPSPWKTIGWTIWQHSQKGTVQGLAYEVDLNVFNGTLNDLKTFVANSRPGLNRIPYARNLTGAASP